MAIVVKGPSVMVESTLGGGAVSRDGVINKAKAMRIILDGVKAAQMGNVVKITIDIQPASLKSQREAAGKADGKRERNAENEKSPSVGANE